MTPTITSLFRSNGERLLWTLLASGGLLVGTFFLNISAHAAVPGYMSDTLSRASPSSTADHNIVFMTVTAIPPGGKVIITPEAGAFTVPDGLSYTDLDLATSSSPIGPFANRTLGPAADATTDGVAVVSGTSSLITITLNSSVGIEANTFVNVRIGLNATVDATPVFQIINPEVIQSDRIFIETQDGGSATIDRGTTMIAIIQSISVSANTIEPDPPIRSNGFPSGTIPGGIDLVELSLNTDSYAKCRYATSAGVIYTAMTNHITSSTYELLHATILNTPGDNTVYNFYVRCINRTGVMNPDDYLISFTELAVLPPIVPGDTVGPPIPPAPTYPPYQPSPPGPQMNITGWTFPRSKVIVLKDNIIANEILSDGKGYFDNTLTNLVQGTYNFGVYAKDALGRRSATYGTTLTLVAGTRNTISDVFLSPTIGAPTTTIASGSNITVSGQSVPSSTIDISMIPQRKGVVPAKDMINVRTASDNGGLWSYQLSTKGLASNTYLIRARASKPTLRTSLWSLPLYVGIGTSPSPDLCSRSDLNNDSKVNLVDFSILLFHWNSSDAIGDINMDGRVNLTDFSVLLYCWTG